MLIETLLGLILGVMLIAIAAGLFEVFASEAEERIANACDSGRHGAKAAGEALTAADGPTH
jgi:hypothetical protein